MKISAGTWGTLIGLFLGLSSVIAILGADTAPGVPPGMSPCVLSSCTVDFVPLSQAEGARMSAATVR